MYFKSQAKDMIMKIVEGMEWAMTIKITPLITSRLLGSTNPRSLR
jgi:hypothetical protein